MYIRIIYTHSYLARHCLVEHGPIRRDVEHDQPALDAVRVLLGPVARVLHLKAEIAIQVQSIDRVNPTIDIDINIEM